MKTNGLQRDFESKMVWVMKMKAGVLATTQDGARYLNEHVQWMREQFQRGDV